MPDDDPTPLRCRLLGHKFTRQHGIGVIWEVCERCNHSRRYRGKGHA
ncbi:DUF1660 family phage protein [Halobacteriales archaeon Cl-PHB]